MVGLGRVKEFAVLAGFETRSLQPPSAITTSAALLPKHCRNSNTATARMSPPSIRPPSTHPPGRRHVAPPRVPHVLHPRQRLLLRRQLNQGTPLRPRVLVLLLRGGWVGGCGGCGGGRGGRVGFELGDERFVDLRWLMGGRALVGCVDGAACFVELAVLWRASLSTSPSPAFSLAQLLPLHTPHCPAICQTLNCPILTPNPSPNPNPNTPPVSPPPPCPSPPARPPAQSAASSSPAAPRPRG